MAHSSGVAIDPNRSPEEFITDMRGHLDGPDGNGLRVSSNGPDHLVIGRTRLGVFIFAMVLSTLVPGAGFIVGFVLIQRNLQWKLRLRAEPWGVGCRVHWELQTPMSQSEQEARLQGRSGIERLSVAYDLLRSA